IMSPRSSCRYGRTFSYQAPVPPKTNLFTSKWSPISSVPSIDADGILKACTMKLVPNSARITVTSSDSRYSEIVVWSARCSCFFFRAALARRHALPLNPNFDLENLLVVGAALSHYAIFSRRLPPSLQEFLQGGLAIRLRDALTALLESLLEQNPSQHLARRTQSAIEVNRGYYRFERIGQQRLLLSTAGFLFPAPQPQLLSQAQPPRSRFEGSCIYNPRAALGKLPFAPLRKTRQEIFARQQLEDGISEKLQPLVVPGKQSRDSLFRACCAQFGDC